jgi:RHS repeat-associated protein
MNVNSSRKRYGQTHTNVYTYNSAGYLERVTKDGVSQSQYSFDLNGNRASHSGPNGNINYTYDAQDRMLTSGSANYTYTANGELLTKSDSSGTTQYQYDVLGNLKKVILPDGKSIEYVSDEKNRRIGKKINGVFVRKWVYKGLLKPAAEYDGQDNLIARYVYGTGTNVPEYMVKNGESYRIITDQLGTVRLVVNAITGIIAQQIDYDEYGIVSSDNNPGYVPFGYAGGLYDQETGLVRFGARDYEPQSGRWTAKDPIGFDGRDLNLYRYVFNDPINLSDPFGLLPPSMLTQGKRQNLIKIINSMTGNRLSEKDINRVIDAVVSATGLADAKTALDLADKQVDGDGVIVINQKKSDFLDKSLNKAENQVKEVDLLELIKRLKDDKKEAIDKGQCKIQ